MRAAIIVGVITFVACIGDDRGRISTTNASTGGSSGVSSSSSGTSGTSGTTGTTSLDPTSGTTSGETTGTSGTGTSGETTGVETTGTGTTTGVETSGTTGIFCGDGVVQGEELCDGDDLGVLSEYAQCADHKLPDEVCDLYGGCGVGPVYYQPGFEVRCNDTCDGLDASGCPYCGDGQTTGTETCDAPNQYISCKELGYDSEEMILCKLEIGGYEDHVYLTCDVEMVDLICG